MLISNAASESVKGDADSERYLLRRAYHCVAVALFFSALFVVFFAPVLLSDRLLAPGDARVQYIPAFFSAPTVWTPLIFAGFPVAAEPQIQTFYPLARGLALFGAWNTFVLSAYVMAAFWTYGYAYRLTRSIVASLIAGVVYSMSGFFVAHLGHTTMIHAAAWLPLLMWGLEELRHARSIWWLLMTALAVASCAVAGHPQILLYGLGMAAAYVVTVGRTATTGRWYRRASLAAVCIGLGLAGVQLAPTAELWWFSPRAHMSFGEFVSYALPLRQLVELIFPNLFGSIILGVYAVPYFGSWSVAETAGYAGVLPLIAAGIGLAGRRDAVSWFWLSVGILSVLLALGGATPLASIAYYVPGYHSFRCPSRHLVETALAVAILAARGVAALQHDAARAPQRARRAACALVVLTAGCAATIALQRDALRAAAEGRGITHLSLLPWHNSAVGIPLLLVLLSAAVIVWYAKRTSSGARAAVLIVVTIVDLASLGWFVEWRSWAPDRSILDTPTALRRYQEHDGSGEPRVLSFVGPAGPRETAMPNLNRLWRIANVTGYTPLQLRRSALALPWADPASLDTGNTVLDILATRYVLLPRRVQAGFEWSANLDVVLGPREIASKRWSVPDVWASQIGIVAALRNSTLIADGTIVASLQVTTTDDCVLDFALRTGDDFSEWAYDRTDVRRFVRHRRAAVFESGEAADAAGGTFPGHTYLAVVDLNGRYRVRALELKQTGSVAGIAVVAMSLGDPHSGASYPVRGGLADAERWRHVEDFGEASVYENLRARPRAWTVQRVVAVTPRTALAALQSSRLPDGSPFDPQAVALVEEPVAFEAHPGDAHAEVTMLKVTDRQIDVRVRAAASAFLVLSDVNYPGWRATIDGRPARVYQTDYLLRGVPVPAGEHVVTFAFRPYSLYLGIAISLCSALALAGFLRRQTADDIPAA